MRRKGQPAIAWRPVLLGRLFGEDRETALAALQRNGQSRLYSVELDSGKVRDRGSIGDGSLVRDIAIAPTSDQAHVNYWRGPNFGPRFAFCGYTGHP